MQSIFFYDLKDYFKHKLNYSSLAHRLCCLFSGLVMLLSLLMCALSFKGAMDELRKYGGLGAPYSLGYYLTENGFPQDVLGFLLLIPEFVLYGILHHRAAELRRPDRFFWYFGAAVLLHGALMMYIVVGPLGYNIFACITLLQAVGYLVAYLLRIRQLGYLIKRG